MTSTETEVSVGRHANVLLCIHEPSKEIAVWERTLPRQLTQWLNQLAPGQLPRARMTLMPGEAALKIRASCDACGTPAVAEREHLIADIADLVKHFAHLAGCDTVRFRLDAIDHNSCSKWHRDSVALRLITTYRGPGTQWVAATGSVDVLARPNDEAAVARTMQAGDVAVFRGKGASDRANGGGIVHRSPPIAGQKLTRLVLVLDLPSH